MLRHPDVMVRFTTALRQGWTTYLDSPDQINALMSTHNVYLSKPMMDAAMAQLSQNGMVFPPAGGVGSMTKARWDTLASQLAMLGLLKSAAEDDPLPFRNIFTP